MQKFLFLIALLFPPAALGQSYEGTYRAVFFNLFSTPKMIVAEFEVKADNSLSGQIKIGESVKTFSAGIDKKGKFEGLIEQAGNFTYKLKGKFDKDNRISLIQRTQAGSGLNKSVSESAIEGKFSRVSLAEKDSESETAAQPQVEMIDSGKNRLKIEHANPLYGTDWTDFTATVGFGNSTVTPAGSEAKKVAGTTGDASDYFVVRVASKSERQQTLSINVPNYTDDKKIWRQNELRTTSYREGSGEQRNTFLAGGETLRTDPRYAGGRLEIVRETDTQVVFKLTDFKIKRLVKEDSVTLNGFIYADK